MIVRASIIAVLVIICVALFIRIVNMKIKEANEEVLKTASQIDELERELFENHFKMIERQTETIRELRKQIGELEELIRSRYSDLEKKL